MHPVIFRTFERVCASRGAGGAVLELGAVPSPKSLLNLRALQGASEKLGINLKGPGSHGDFTVVCGNANDLSRFPDSRFDTVLSNAMLEHDRYFWKTLAEVRRVLRPGGLFVVGVPGFTKRRKDRWLSRLRRAPVVGGLFTRRMDFLNSTVTYRVHNDPGDYWRFSEEACRQVLLEGFEQVEVVEVMSPPRLVASGRRAAGGP